MIRYDAPEQRDQAVVGAVRLMMAVVGPQGIILGQRIAVDDGVAELAQAGQPPFVGC